MSTSNIGPTRRTQAEQTEPLKGKEMTGSIGGRKVKWKSVQAGKSTKAASKTLGKHRTGSQEKVAKREWVKGTPQGQTRNKKLFKRLSNVTIGKAFKRLEKAKTSAGELEKKVASGEKKLENLASKRAEKKKEFEELQKKHAKRREVNIGDEESKKLKKARQAVREKPDDLYGMMEE